MTESSDNIVPITPDARSAAEKFGAEHDSELLTILFTDLVDSTKLQSELGNVEAARLVELHRGIVHRALEAFAAREIEWAGDSCLAVFSKPSDAVVFSLKLLGAMAAARGREDNLPHLRIGLHLGEILVRHRDDGGKHSEDLFGLQVSEAARVMSLARGNQIYCTRSVYDNARTSLLSESIDGVGEVKWVNHGLFELKGSDDLVEVCEVGEVGVSPLTPPQANDKCRPFKGDPAKWRKRRAKGVLGRRGVPAVAVALLVIAGVAIGLFGGFNLGMRSSSDEAVTARAPEPQPEPVKRYSINLSPDAPLQALDAQGFGSGLALSPDGLLLAYVASTGPGTKQLFLRRLDLIDDAQPLAGTEGALYPFFSPDGQWIGFVTPDKLKKVSVRGGTPITLCDRPADFGTSWGDDGHLVFSSGFGQGLKRISAAGGPVEDLMDESFMESHGFLVLIVPILLPGGKSVLFTSAAGLSADDFEISAFNLETGEVKTLVAGAVARGYHPTGHLIYMQERALMAAPFDPGALEITDPPILLTEEKMTLQPLFKFPDLFGISNEGTMVYAPRSEDPPKVPVARTLVWVDREGNEEPLQAPPRPYSEVDLSPDGTHVAVLFHDAMHQGDIWILDLTREPVTQQRLTFEPKSFYFPMWTPDSQRVVFGSLRDGVFSLSSMAANGTGDVNSLHTSKNLLVASTWSADGRYLFFSELMELSLDPGSVSSDIWALSLDGEPTARPLMAESYNEIHPVISPDGRWLAYVSEESGAPNVYVRPFPNVDDGKWLISARGGEYPIWAPDGGELYYYAPTGQMMVVTIETEPAFAVGNSEELLGGEYVTFGASRPYDISPDGQRFLMIKEAPRPPEAAQPVQTPPITELIVVENWDEVLKGIAPDPETN